MSYAGGTPGGQQLAGWWYRVGATILDGLIIGIPATLVTATAPVRLRYAILVVVQLAYVSILLSTQGRTVGMRAVGTRCVVASSGTNPSLAQALLRTAVSAVSNIAAVILPSVGLGLGLFTLLDDLWPLWDPMNQTIHDKVAGTLVVRVPAGYVEPPYPQGQSGQAPYGGQPGYGYGQSAGGWGQPAGGYGSTEPASGAGGWGTQAGEQAPSVPAAWYPDPDGSGRERWWDGRSWTGHVRDRT